MTENLDYTDQYIKLRVLALIIDQVIMTLAQLLTIYLIDLIFSKSLQLDKDFFANIGFTLGVLINILYPVIPVILFGHTPGKYIFGLRIVHMKDEMKLGWGQVFVREIFVKVIAILISPITLTVYAFGDSDYLLHDRVCSTKIIKKG